MSVIDKISRPIETRTIEVKHEKITYRVTGRPDPNILSRALYNSASDTAKFAEHWKTTAGVEFDDPARMVRAVLLVTDTLEHEDNPAQRYDQTQIAQLANSDAVLFLKLADAASEVTGLVSTVEDVLDEAVEGNSEAPEGA